MVRHHRAGQDPRCDREKLAADIAKAVKNPDVLARFQGDGTLAVGNTPAEFAEFIREEQERWGDVVRRSGVKAE